MVSKYNPAVLALSAALALAAGAGCDGDSGRGTTPPPGAPAAVNPPTTLPAPNETAATAAAPAPASQPTASYLWIHEVPDPRKSQADDAAAGTSRVDETWTPVQFPRARLRLAHKGEDKLVALLYSDDPKEAISKNWQGDRYYFRMPLPYVPDAKALDGAPYRMSVPLEGAEETTNGVFLKGDRYHLEPVDLSVRFEVQGGLVNVYVGGRFKQYDTTDVEAEPRWFHLQGIVQAVAD